MVVKWIAKHTVYAEYLASQANRSKIVVGVTLIWQKAVAVGKYNSYRPEMALFR